MVPGWLQIALVVVLVLVFFGRGRVSEFMGDLAKGITSFKKGLKEEDAQPQQVADKADTAEAAKTSEKEKTEA